MAARLLRAAGRARIERAGSAYFACAFLATALVAAVGLPLALLRVAWMGRWAQFDPGAFAVQGAIAWLSTSVLGLFAAWPFVALATWAGKKRLHLESALYYALTGGGTATAIVLLIFGLRALSNFGTANFAWIIVPPSGVSWGLMWWFLHRRWRAPSREGPTNVISIISIPITARAFTR